MQIIFKKNDLEKMISTTKEKVEYFGKMCCYFNGTNYHIDEITFPAQEDELKPFCFYERSEHHKNIIKQAVIERNSYFIGTWHSHRCFSTKPSKIDLNSFQRNYECTIFHFSLNIIVSTKNVLFICIDNNKIKKFKFPIKIVLFNNEFILDI